MKIPGLVLLVALVSGIGIFAFNFLSHDSSQNKFSRPWQVSVDEAGTSEVFKLKLGKSNINDALRLFVTSEQFLLTTQFVLIQNQHVPQEIKLEAYFEKINLSGITGKLVLVFTGEGDFDSISAWRTQDKASLNLEEKFVHIPQDKLKEFEFLLLSNITLVPNKNLSEQQLLTTFGKADEKIKMNDKTSHFLYPKIGVDVAINQKAKDIIQYVPPKDFYKIREPLLK